MRDITPLVEAAGGRLAATQIAYYGPPPEYITISPVNDAIDCLLMPSLCSLKCLVSIG